MLARTEPSQSEGPLWNMLLLMIHCMCCSFPMLPSHVVIKDFVLGSLLCPAVMVSGSSPSRCFITWARTWHCKQPVVSCYTCPSKLSKFIQNRQLVLKTCAVCEIAAWSSVLVDTQCIANWAVLKTVMGRMKMGDSGTGCLESWCKIHPWTHLGSGWKGFLSNLMVLEDVPDYCKSVGTRWS